MLTAGAQTAALQSYLDHLADSPVVASGGENAVRLLRTHQEERA